MTDAETAEQTQLFPDILRYWKELSTKDKIIAIVAAIRESEAEMSTVKVMEKLASKAHYPFTPDDIPLCPEELAAGLGGVCHHSGRVKLGNGKIVEWQIWKYRSEYSVDIICW